MRLALVTDAWLPQVNGVTGALDLDLRRACLRALTVHRTACRAHALQHTWSRCADLLEERLQVFAWS